MAVETAVADVKAEGQQAEVNADSSMDDVVNAAKANETQSVDDTSTSEVEAEAAAGEAEKTQVKEELSPEQKAEAEEKVLLESNKPIPYDRFKKVIEQKNQTKEEVVTLREQIEQINNFLKDPEAVKRYCKENGIDITGKQDENKSKEVSSEEELESTLEKLSKGLDLETQKGWQMYQYRVAQLVAEQTAQAGIKKYDQERMTKEQVADFIKTTESEARKLCAEVYNLPYGETGKSEKDTTTAIGKMTKYLDKHPEDAGLGHAKLLRLALSEEGYKAAEKKGEIKEKKRQEELKKAAIETDETSTVDSTPNEDWSVEKILEWNKTHPQK